MAGIGYAPAGRGFDDGQAGHMDSGLGHGKVTLDASRTTPVSRLRRRAQLTAAASHL